MFDGKLICGFRLSKSLQNWIVFIKQTDRWLRNLFKTFKLFNLFVVCLHNYLMESTDIVRCSLKFVVSSVFFLCFVHIVIILSWCETKTQCRKSHCWRYWCWVVGIIYRIMLPNYEKLIWDINKTKEERARSINKSLTDNHFKLHFFLYPHSFRLLSAIKNSIFTFF